MFELTTFAKQIFDIMVGAVSPVSALSYTLTHHVYNPFDPCATGYIIGLGNFLIAADAREAAQNAIDSTILKLKTFGFVDFSTSSRDVGEWTKELITFSKFDGEEGVLSSFFVEEGVTWVYGREDVAMEQLESAVVVRLPPCDTRWKIETNGEKACPLHYPAFEEERAADWAQSRMPPFRRRDEDSSHDVSDKSHTHDMESVVGERQENAQEQQEADGGSYKNNVQGSALGGGEDIGPIHRGRRHSAGASFGRDLFGRCIGFEHWGGRDKECPRCRRFEHCP